MDTLTHALSGALLARVVAPHLPQATAPTLRRALVVGTLCAAFPDSDVVISLVSDQLTYLNLHRGVTHSLLLLPLWALLFAALFSLYDRHRHYWRAYFILALGAIAIHIAGDVITTYGTQILAPFSSWKASVPLTFIIDPWFSSIIIAGLLASWWWRNSTRPALIALAILFAYVGLQASLNGRAAALGEMYAAQQGFRDAQVVALPQPLSPFNWKVIVTTPEHYAIAYVNLRRDNVPSPLGEESGLMARINALYLPVRALAWQRQAPFGEVQEEQQLSREVWQAPAMAPVRRFIEFPALAQIHHHEVEGTCVWFDDLRFTLADVRSPFRFGACRNDGQSEVRLFRLIGNHLTPL
ncbi:MAG TPA: metal-dependent hydrolase [Gammaproteobacteria bacterium]